MEHTRRRKLDIEIKAINLYRLVILPIKRSRSSLSHPRLTPRPKSAPKEIRKRRPIPHPREAIRIQSPTKRKEDLLPVQYLANRDISNQIRALRLQCIERRIVSGAGVDVWGPPACVREIGAWVAVSLRREDVQEGEGDDVDCALLAVV